MKLSKEELVKKYELSNGSLYFEKLCKLNELNLVNCEHFEIKGKIAELDAIITDAMIFKNWLLFRQTETFKKLKKSYIYLLLRNRAKIALKKNVK